MGREEMRGVVKQRVVALLMGIVISVSAPYTFAYADACPSGGEHTYEAEITRYPTDDEEGVRHYLCTKCGYSLDKVIPAVGHAWSAWVTDVEPTCTHEGHEYRECAKQNDVTHREERILATLSPTGDHVYELTSEVGATCTEAGYRTSTCTYCGTAQTEEIPSLGHEWGEWVTLAEPGPTTDGEKQRVCAHDESHKEIEVIPATGEEKPVPEKEAEIIKSNDVPKASPLVAEPQSPETPMFYLNFTTFDAAFIVFDAVVAIVFFVFTIPFIMQFRFNQKRRAAARRKRNQKAVETERAEWEWQR